MLFSKTANFFTSLRSFSRTSQCFVKRIKESVDGDLTIVELESLPESQKPIDFVPTRQLDVSTCNCSLCKIPVKISYQDVLILEQFMRLDGTVLPKELTGLCDTQQQRLERCVMQAHWSGLFPDRTIPEFDRSGYKRFNRHWDDDMAMFRLKFKMQPGSWFYIKRYNPRAALYKKKRDEVVASR
ncbi:hypothetical protein Mgra_00004162 [Meloidogyne graminicola]|uniref:28S ribosomal protein S18a, mitochondrial n=1 Tax=Meloidogyne graminicola TaxID=189291 RepID=A0A8S9ZTR5_9BILA|nr:hypothetical protein Mgra_00004162 [Meloidogyne graminicola]